MSGNIWAFLAWVGVNGDRAFLLELWEQNDSLGKFKFGKVGTTNRQLQILQLLP